MATLNETAGNRPCTMKLLWQWLRSIMGASDHSPASSIMLVDEDRKTGKSHIKLPPRVANSYRPAL